MPDGVDDVGEQWEVISTIIEYKCTLAFPCRPCDAYDWKHSTRALDSAPSATEWCLPVKLRHLEDQSVKKGGKREQVTYGWDER